MTNYPYLMLSTVLLAIIFDGIPLDIFALDPISASSSGEQAEEGHCIWYGVCDKTAMLPCSYNGSAVLSDDPVLYGVIKTFCPEFLVNETHVETCCDGEQARKLGADIAIPEAILGRCPSAWDNIRHLICYMTCAPDQSRFIRPKTLGPVN